MNLPEFSQIEGDLHYHLVLSLWLVKYFCHNAPLHLVTSEEIGYWLRAMSKPSANTPSIMKSKRGVCLLKKRCCKIISTSLSGQDGEEEEFFSPERVGSSESNARQAYDETRHGASKTPQLQSTSKEFYDAL